MTRPSHSSITARTRLTVTGLCGIVLGAIVAVLGHSKIAPLAAWDSAALLYLGSVLLTVLRYDAAQTKAHALRENPGRTTADSLLILAGLASLIAIAALIVQAHHVQGAAKVGAVLLTLVSVVVSWATVHTIFLLKYASLYYGDPEGGIDFNEQAAPRYADFAYMAFTVGMTFQVSDTELQTQPIRATVLKQALLAYVFGTVIIAATINTLASLSS